MNRQFVTRRTPERPTSDGLNHGWDEIIDGKPTGRIAMGWRCQNGEMEVEYLDTPIVKIETPDPEDWGSVSPIVTRRTTPDPEDWGSVSKPPVIPDEDWDTILAPVLVIAPPLSVAEHFDSTAERLFHQPAVDRYYVEFRWHYGVERFPIDTPSQDAAKAALVHLRSTFRGLDFTDCRIIHEQVRAEDLGEVVLD